VRWFRILQWIALLWGVWGGAAICKRRCGIRNHKSRRNDDAVCALPHSSGAIGVGTKPTYANFISARDVKYTRSLLLCDMEHRVAVSSLWSIQWIAPLGILVTGDRPQQHRLCIQRLLNGTSMAAVFLATISAALRSMEPTIAYASVLPALRGGLVFRFTIHRDCSGGAVTSRKSFLARCVADYSDYSQVCLPPG